MRAMATGLTLLKRIGALLHPEREWVWLAYLPFYVVPWFYQAPSRPQFWASALGITVFLCLYALTALRRIDAWQGAMAIFALSLTLAPLGANWSVISVFAAAIAGQIRPPLRALQVVAGFAIATAAVGFGFGMPWLWWLPGFVLIVMVGLSTTASKALSDKNAALLAAQDEVRQLGRIAERERIARDLHDVIGRDLTLIALKADLAAKLVMSDPVASAEEARAIAATAREGLRDVRQALAGERQALLANEIDHAHDLLRTAGIDCTVSGDPATIAPDRQGVLAMYLREAVTNVVRHSSAAHCRITIAIAHGVACITVSDDGNGPPIAEGSGIGGMRARLVAAGGTLDLARSEEGLRLTAAVPSA